MENQATENPYQNGAVNSFAPEGARNLGFSGPPEASGERWEMKNGRAEGESSSRQHCRMTLIFLISFNILAVEKSARNLAFRLDFPGEESVTVW